MIFGSFFNTIIDSIVAVARRTASGATSTGSSGLYDTYPLSGRRRIIIKNTMNNPVTVSAFSKQIGGNHYKDMGIQPIEYITKNNIGWCLGNAIKYITRHEVKGGKDDLLKAIHYIEMEIERVYGNTDTVKIGVLVQVTGSPAQLDLPGIQGPVRTTQVCGDPDCSWCSFPHASTARYVGEK